MNIIKSTLEGLHPESFSRLSHYIQGLLKYHLWAQVLFGFCMGIGAGLFFSQNPFSINPSLVTSLTEWIAFPGYLFLRLMQMIVIPLIFASIVLGVASSENPEQLKKLGLRIAVYFVGTTIVSLTIGVIIASIIKPGNYINITVLSGIDVSPVDLIKAPTQVSIQDRVLGVLPSNPFAAMNDSNMIQVVAFALIVGVALISIATKQAQPLVDLLSSMQEVCMRVVNWSLYLAPLAVFGLTTKMVASVGLGALTGLGAYVVTVIIGLLSVLLFYLFVVSFVAKRNPITFLKEIFNVQLLAFSTSSSAVVMPLSIKTAEEKLKVKPSVAQFIIPLGSTINMDGTAIYQMIATMFLAQAYGIDLSTSQLILVGLASVGASIGSPGTPGVGIVILATILQSVGIPIEGTGLIIAVDRILDMIRTSINVSGDLTATVVMDRLTKS
ncbi:MAG: dicarboxylate/amino acid:cation symporter [Bdellovibrionales bacterium]